MSELQSGHLFCQLSLFSVASLPPSPSLPERSCQLPQKQHWCMGPPLRAIAQHLHWPAARDGHPSPSATTTDTFCRQVS